MITEVTIYHPRQVRDDVPCCECGHLIPQGATYEHAYEWSAASGLQIFRTCAGCAEARSRFGSPAPRGLLWSWIELYRGSCRGLCGFTRSA